MTIKEIRRLTGMSQVDFGKQYNIPLSTLKKWEADPNKQNYRECPIYVKQLLEKVIRTEFNFVGKD